MWGSDYPHAEGTFPISRKITKDLFAGLDVSEADKAKILGLNAASLFKMAPMVSTPAVSE
jgi:predicted TIM-barrel fold metal-dependent hydrolase